MEGGDFHSKYMSNLFTAAVFFCTYEFVKKNALWNHSERTSVIKHVTAASCGELVSTLDWKSLDIDKKHFSLSKSLLFFVVKLL